MTNFERNTRTKEQIWQRINEIKAAWKEVGEKAPDTQSSFRDNWLGQLEMLYWCSGNSLRESLDKACIALGDEEGIDWSGLGPDLGEGVDRI